MLRQIHVVAFFANEHVRFMVNSKMFLNLGCGVEIYFTVVATFQIEPFYEQKFMRQRNVRNDSFLLR